MTNHVIVTIVSCIIGYLCGNLLSGFLIGKKEHVDLRKEGSGNVGTTNTLRILGIKAGVFTMVMDICKSIIAVGLVWLIFHDSVDAVMIKWYEVLGAFFAVLGHDFPFYMGFKGGKGIATSAGMIIALFPQELPLCVLAMVLSVAIYRYVSLGSILCAILFVVQTLVMGQMGWLNFDPSILPRVYVVVIIVSAIAIWRHRANIVRLLHGEENKFSIHKSEKKNN